VIVADERIADKPHTGALSVKVDEPDASGNEVQDDQVRQKVRQMAASEPGDYTLFSQLIQFSLELAANCYFDQALWVADETIALASGRSRLGGGPSRRRHRGGIGKRITDLAELTREQILILQAESDHQG
jgi:hypothetical protein